jgi:tRNA(fMet)-specific endonuclease VapC
VADISSEIVIREYARLDYASRNIGRRMGKNDLWIAAVASVQSAVIVTTDQDFDHLNPNLVKVELIDVQMLLAAEEG